MSKSEVIECPKCGQETAIENRIDLLVKVSELKAQLAQMREALEYFGGHSPLCTWAYNSECTCGFTEALSAPCPAADAVDNHVAWLRYKHDGSGRTWLELCDSDSEGAFKVYRKPGFRLPQTATELMMMEECHAEIKRRRDAVNGMVEALKFVAKDDIRNGVNWNCEIHLVEQKMKLAKSALAEYRRAGGDGG